jgi:hypothetical protein
LDEVLRRYHVAGEPIYPQDFDQPSVPDAENAAFDLIAAADLVNDRRDAWREFNLLEPALPLDQNELCTIGELLDGSRDLLGRLDSAMAKPAARWRQLSERDVLDPLPWPANVYSLRVLLRGAALQAHQLGHERDSFWRIRQLLMTQRIMARDPTGFAHFLACGTSGEACDAILQIAPDLLVGADSNAAVPPSDVLAVIDELMDDRAMRGSLVRGLQGDRLELCRLVRGVVDGKIDLMGNTRHPTFAPAVAGYFIKPVALRDTPLMTAHVSGILDAARAASDWPAFLERAPDMDRVEPFRSRPYVHPVGAILVRCYERPMRQHFRALAARHLAATALAIRCYAIDHDGTLPERLEELVPAYLPAPPVDPMARGGRMLGYLPQGTDPVLYSVGDNGKDDGGSEKLARKGRRFFQCQLLDWENEDAVVHLVRQPRVRDDPREE